MERKIEYFNAFLIELLEWYKKDVDENVNDLSKLKVLKLLFLWASKNEEALNIFDNFVAWDLWPVERDLYNAIKNSNSDLFFKISNNKLLKINDWKLSDESEKNAKELIDFLKRTNRNLIKKSASSLVDITHKWNCWDITRSFGIEKISKNLILSEEWYFN